MLYFVSFAPVTVSVAASYSFVVTGKPLSVDEMDPPEGEEDAMEMVKVAKITLSSGDLVIPNGRQGGDAVAPAGEGEALLRQRR